MRINLSVLKVIAVLSVVVAHVNNDPVAAGYVYFRNFSLWGVPIFLTLLGLQWADSSRQLSGRVAPWLLTSWLLWASVVYVVTNLFGNAVPLTFSHWFVYVLGYGSIFYYVPVYLFLVLVLSRLSPHWAPALFIVSLAVVGAMDFFHIFSLDYHLYGYLNPLYWALYPALGAFLAKWPRAEGTHRWFQFVCSGVCTVVSAFLIPADSVAYFSLASTLFACSSTVFLVTLSSWITIGRNTIESNSWFIYLAHLPLAGFVSHLQLFSYPASVFLRVIIVVGVFYVTLSIATWGFRHLKSQNWVRALRLMGVRQW